MTVSMGGNSMTIAFQAEIDGARMAGSASLGEFGNATFTAEKRP
jgi:hypothetical protein